MNASDQQVSTPGAPLGTQSSAAGFLPRRVQAGLLLLLAACGIVFAWKSTMVGVGKDFFQFWVIGQSLDRPGLNIYADDARRELGVEFFEKAKQSASPRLMAVSQYRQVLETYSSPFLYALFRLFSTGDYEVDFRNFRLLLLVSFVLGTLTFCRLLNHTWTTAFGATAVFSIWYDPLASDLIVGNVNCLQFATLAAYLWTVKRMPWRHRDFAGGALLGIAVTFKPNLIFVAGVLAIHWILSGRLQCLWLHATGAIAGGIGAVLFSATSFRDLRCWGEWVSALRSLPDDVILVVNGNSSPAEIICESFHLNVAIPFAAVLIGLSIVMLWHRRATASGKDGGAGGNGYSDAFAVSLGCLLVVMASRLAWFHYYVLAIPTFLFLLQPSAVSASGTRTAVSRLLPILAFACLTPLSSMGNPLFANPQAVFAASAALLLFLSLAIFRTAPKPAVSTLIEPNHRKLEKKFGHTR